MRRKIGFLSWLAGFSCLVLAGVLAVVNGVGTNEELYYRLQLKEGILDFAGISGEDLRRLDGALADCLRGDADATLVSAEVFGELRPAFNHKERIHMEDCRRLFVLLRTVMGSAAALAAGFLACGAYLLRDRRRICIAAWLSPLAIVVPLGALACWAVIDFGAAFNFFHEILFTNDLWLLNPATDLLIRICPAGMFMAMGARIGLLSFAWALGVPALTMAAIKERV